MRASAKRSAVSPLTHVFKTAIFTEICSFLTGMSKVLVASGYDLASRKTVEIVNLDENSQNLICEDLPNLPYGASTGQLFQKKDPIIFGCDDSSGKVQILQNGSWISSGNSFDCRFITSSAVLENSEGKEILVLIGGIVRGKYITVTEAFDGITWNNASIPSIPEAVSHNCIAKLDASAILSIGREGPNGEVNSTQFYDAKTNKWTSGPSMNTARLGVNCGILRRKNPDSGQMEKVVVVAGGFNYVDGQLSSVELLRLNEDNSAKGEWVQGPKLPKAVFEATMIEFNNSLVMIGGTGNVDGHHMYQLTSLDDDWKEMKQTLKKLISNHVAFLVPDELVNCHL
jgi:hypothetical protein